MEAIDPLYAPWAGNAEAMASDIGENPITVRQWRNRGSIPPRYWRKIIAAAASREQRLTLEQFALMAEQGSGASPPPFPNRSTGTDQTAPRTATTQAPESTTHIDKVDRIGSPSRTGSSTLRQTSSATSEEARKVAA